MLLFFIIKKIEMVFDGDGLLLQKNTTRIALFVLFNRINDQFVEKIQIYLRFLILQFIPHFLHFIPQKFLFNFGG